MSPKPALVSKTLALGAGSFWGTQKYIVEKFQQQFPGSIEGAQVGFMHPDQPRLRRPPTYQDVCTGTTGYIEVLYISLAKPTPEIVEELFKFFFMFHDPTTKNRQGNDLGTHFASAIFCSDGFQLSIARHVMGELQAAISQGTSLQYKQTRAHTKIVELSQFYPAPQEHRGYLKKNPTGYCNHFVRFQDWPKTQRVPALDVHTTSSSPTHRRWNRGSIYASFSKILAKLPQDELEPQMIEIKRPTHRRWNRKSIFYSFTKILNELDEPTLPVDSE